MKLKIISIEGKNLSSRPKPSIHPNEAKNQELQSFQQAQHNQMIEEVVSYFEQSMTRQDNNNNNKKNSYVLYLRTTHMFDICSLNNYLV